MVINLPLSFIDFQGREETLFIENRNLAAYCFISLFDFQKLNDIPFDFQPYIQPLRSFFLDCQELPQSCFDILPDVTKTIDEKATCKISDLFFKSLEAIIERRHKNITPEAIQSIIAVIQNNSNSLTLSKLSFVKKTTELYGPDIVMDYISSLPLHLTNIMQNMDTIITKNVFTEEKTEPIMIDISPQQTLLNNLRVTDGTTFTNTVEVDDLNPNDFKVKPIETLINQTILDLISSILIIMQGNDILCDCFIANTCALITDLRPSDAHYIDIMALITFTFIHIQNVVCKSNAISFFFDIPLFDSQQSMFDQKCEEYSSIYIIRYHIISLLMKCKVELLQEVLQKVINYPLMLAEVIFLITLQSGIELTGDAYEKNQLILNITLKMHRYRTFQCTDDNKDLVCQARISFFYLLKKIIMSAAPSFLPSSNNNENKPETFNNLTTEICELFMNSDNFLNEFSIMNFENPTRSYTLSLLLRYMKTLNGTKNANLLVSLKSQCSALFLLPLNSTNIPCAIDFLDFFTNLFEQCPIYVKSFEDLISSACERLSDLDEKESKPSFTSLYITKILTLLRIMSKMHAISQKEYIQIENGIEKIYSANPPFIILKLLLELAKGENIQSLRDTFEVSHAKCIEIILHTFNNSDQFIAIIRLLIELSNSSEKNKREFHEHGIDLCVIEIIRKEPNIEVVKKALKLLHSISSLFSSATVVNRFFSLFCPVKNKYLPKYQEIVLSFFNKLILGASKLPECGYPLSINVDTPILKGFSSELMKNSSMTLWVFLKEKKGTIYLTTFYDENNTAMSVCIIDGKITTIVEHGDKMWQGPPQIDVPINQWFPIAVSFYSKDQQYLYVHLFRDGETFQRQVFQACEIKPSKMFMNIGNKGSDNNTSLLGPVGIYDYQLTEDKINYVFETNPHSIPYDAKPLLYIIPAKEGDRITLRLSNQDITCSYIPPKNRDPFSFIDIVSTRIGYSVLTPLFAELDFPFENGEILNNYAIKIVYLIRNAFALNPRGQSEFFTCSGFQVISYLLHSANTSHLTYELYMSFVNLAMVLTDKLLIQELYTYILADLTLWIESKEIYKISKHWGYSLFPNAQNVISKFLTFKEIIQVLRSKFYYEPIEVGIVIPTNNGVASQTIAENEKNIKKVRKNIIVAAFSIALVSSQRDNYEILVNHIITSGDERQQVELLELLYAIISCNRSTAQQEQNDNAQEPIYSQLLLLPNLVATKRPKIISLMLLILIQMHKIFSVTEISLDEHLQMILEQIPNSCLTKELFSEIFAYVDKEPYLFPLCCYIAFCVGKEEQETIFTELKPDIKFTEPKFWTTWPARIFVNSSGMLRIKIINFVIFCGCSAWLPFLNATDFIGRATNSVIYQLEHDFISAAGAHVLEHFDSLNNTEADAFLTLIRNFVFLKQFGYVSDAVKSFDPNLTELNDVIHTVEPAYKNSPSVLATGSSYLSVINPDDFTFSTMTSPFMMTIQNINQVKDLSVDFRTEAITLHEKLLRTRKERHFGVRMNKKGELQDTDLLQICLAVYEMKPIPNHLSTVIICCAFLLRTSAGRARSFMAQYVNEKDLPEEIAIYNDRAYQTHNAVFGTTDRSETAELAFELLEQFSKNDTCSIFANKYLEFLDSISEKAFRLLSLAHKPLITTVLQESKHICEALSSSNFVTRKKWRAVWRSLTIDGCPWSSAILEDSTQILRKKREVTACLFSVPMLIRRYYSREKKQNISSLQSLKPILDCAEEIDDVNIETSKTVHRFIEKTECEIITLTKTIKGFFIISQDSITMQKEGEFKKAIKFKYITNIFIKPWCQQLTALEIYGDNGSFYFVNFKKGENINILMTLRQFQLPKLKFTMQLSVFSPKEQFVQSHYTSHWLNGRVSNFEYLVALNVFSGRTFNSVMQYPIFPWILQNYDSETLDLNDPNTYRNLSKPISSIDQHRLSELVARSKEQKTFFFYEETYSTPRNVCKLLSQIEPFKMLSMEEISSLQEEHENALHALGPYCELTPEFFYSQDTVENIALPKWADSPFDFVYNHRKALESNFVSQNMHRWIDLVWGKRQRGSDAISSMNIFDDSLYFNPGTEPKQDSEAFLNGQIPIQLFTDYHPQKRVVSRPTLDLDMKRIRFCQTNVIGALVTKSQKPFIQIVSIFSDGKLFAFKLTDELMQQVSNSPNPVYDLKTVPSLAAQFQNLVAHQTNDQQLFTKKIPNFESIHRQCSEHIPFITALARNNFVIVGSEKDSVYVINYNAQINVLKLDTNDTFITCVASQHDYVAIADSESLVNVYKIPDFDHPHAVVQVCSSLIKCISVSGIFHIAACGTKDGSIVIITLTTRTISRIIQLENSYATNIIVTNGWGFIVAFTKEYDANKAKMVHKIIVMTCNGDIVKQTNIDSQPTYVTHFTDNHAFDYVVYGDEAGYIYLFEAYYPEKKRAISSGQTNILALDALYNANYCLIVSNDGFLSFCKLFE